MGIAMGMKTRRDVLMQGGLLAAVVSCGLFSLQEARAFGLSDAAFNALAMNDVVRLLGSEAVSTDQITITLPDLAENGANVPVTVVSHISGTEEISILCDSNPFPLVAQFGIPPGTDAFISTRLKMAQSGNVLAFVRVGNRLYSASRAIQVMVGGCGA